MSEDTDNSRVPVTHPEVGWQLAMAFGQGVGGTLMASQSALRIAFDSYGRQLTDDPHWSQIALHALEFARILGRVAGAHATQNGRCVIDDSDVNYALEAVRRTRLEPLLGCALTGRDK